MPVLSNKISPFAATGSPTLQRQDGCVQLLHPVEVPLLIDLLLYARVELHRRDSGPREEQSAHGEQCGTGCHRSLNDHPGRPFRLDDLKYPPEG